MNGRLARKLRKINEFDPHAKRHYFCLNNANNFVLSNSGEPERIGGTIIEATTDKNPVTARAKYKFMKEMYYAGAF